MRKEGNYSGGAKVYESKKEKKRRLLANNDLVSEEFFINPLAEIVRDGNGADSGMPSIVMEKGDNSGEKRVTRAEVFSRKLGGEGSEEKFMEASSDGECGGIEQPHGDEIKSVTADSSGDQTDATVESSKILAFHEPTFKIATSAKKNVLESKSERKRCIEMCDDEFMRKKSKADHMDSVEDQTEKSGVDKTLTIVEQTDEGMYSTNEDVQVSKVPVSCAKESRGQGSSEMILEKDRWASSKSIVVRRRGRPRKIENQNVKDARFSGIVIKDGEDGGRSQENYVKLQGKGVMKVLQSGKDVSVHSDSIIQVKEQDSRRRLRSSVKNKFSMASHSLERQVIGKPISNMKRRKRAGKVSSEGPSKPSVSGKKQKTIILKEGLNKSKLLHRKPELAVKNVKNTKESGTSRGEAKRKLREQIINILLDAGWRIELRPRMSRNYEDSIYVSPHGGAGYWSIVKAYNVYVKELEIACYDKAGSNKQSKAPMGRVSDSGDVISAFDVIPPELLLLLKKNRINGRRTKKEIEEARRLQMEDPKCKVGVWRKKKKAKELKKKNIYKDKGTKDGVLGTTAKRKLIVRNSKRRGCSILVRGSNKDEGSEKGDYAPYVWKRTVISWMIDLGILTAYGKVRYMNKRRSKALLDGRITRDGIQCSCCSKIFSVSKFEIHAGSKLHQPYENLCMEMSGISLLQYQINAWEKESKECIFYDVDTDGDDPNDDTCGICGDGGDLICCDSCPSTFHLGCLGIEMLPSGDWHCTNCSCKFCGAVHDSASNYGSASNSLFTCSQCAKKYHKDCIPEVDVVPHVPNSYNNMFCGRSCRKVFRKLQKLIGVRNKLDTGFCWSIVHRFDDPSKPLPRMTQRVESNSKIAIAYDVMDECFVPIIDQRSGINLIHNVVFNCGANFNRLNFSGFYTFILERGDEIIAAASVRIHDTRLAEMPFIGTRIMYRRQGMCRRLLKGIESALRSLCINKLIIPAISELTETWTTVFGFKPLEISQKEEVKSTNMLVFPDTGLLQKSLIKDSNKQCTNSEQENKLESQTSVKEDENYSVDGIRDSKELKCDAEALLPNLPVSEHTAKFLAEASRCDVQFWSSVEGVADVELDDLQKIKGKNFNDKEDENTVGFLQNIKGALLINGVVHDVCLGKHEIATEDEVVARDINAVKLTRGDSEFESNVNEGAVEVSVDSTRHLSTSSGKCTCGCSEACGDGCGANSRLSCGASFESSCPDKSVLPTCQLKYHLEASNSALLEQLTVSGSAERLDVDDVCGFIRTNFTTCEGSFSKLKESTSEISQHFTSTCEAGDDFHADAYNSIA